MPSQDLPKACPAMPVVDACPPIDHGRTYLFASQPATPKDKPADILVRFQALSRDHPVVDAKAIFISSRCTLLETRRILHKFFSSTYDRGFIFLQHGKEVLRHKERFLRLVDVMPRYPLGIPKKFFRFPDVQYKKISLDKDGCRVWSYFAGIVFLCEKSAHERWQRTQLVKELNADRIEGFSFLPGNIWSARANVLDNNVETICELSALGSKKKLAKELENLPEGISVDTFRDNYFATPLHHAANKGDVATAEILVGRFGREMLYLQNWEGLTALHRAIYSHRLDLVSYLLNLGPDLQIKDNLGNSCHRLIVSLCDFDTDYLLRKVELSVLESTLILHFVSFAFKKKDVAMCRKLCVHVHPVEAPFYRPPLHQAAELGDVEVVETLLQRQQNCRIVYTDEKVFDNISILSEEFYLPNSDPRDSQSYAHVDQNDHQNNHSIAIAEVVEKSSKGNKIPNKKFDLDIISDLDIILDEVGEKHRSDVYDSDGHLPFHYACQHGHSDIIGHLYFDSMDSIDFIKGIKLALNWNRFSALKILAHLRGDFKLDTASLATLVKEVDKDLGKRGPCVLPLLKQAPLVLTRFTGHAAATNDIDNLQLLLNLNVSMACTDLMGRTPLHEACQNGKEAAMRFLLLNGADPMARDWRGSTALHYACAAGQLDVVCVLATRDKVDLASLDVCQRTPVLVAAQSKHHDVLLFLIVEHADRVDLLRHDANGDCVLNYLHSFDEDMFKIVLEAAVKQKEANRPHTSPFMVAPHNTDADVVEAWSEPVEQHKNMDDVRADIHRKYTMKKATQITCLQCGKKRTTLHRLTRWSHLCSTSTPSSRDERGTRQKVIYSVKDESPSTKPVAVAAVNDNDKDKNTKKDKKNKKKDKKENKKSVNNNDNIPSSTTTTTTTNNNDDDNKNTSNTKSTDVMGKVSFEIIPISLPQEHDYTTPKNVETPLDVLVSKRKWDLIPDLLTAFPSLRRVTRSAYSAARLADARVIKLLHKAENFSKDTFTWLLHVALLNVPKDNSGSEKLVKFVKFILKMGASPNFIPVKDKFEMNYMTAVEMKFFHFMPLEIAAISDNEKLIDLLLEHEASASICFAVHIAALKGNLSILQKLIPHWREGRWKPYIKGFKDDATELVRVCTLESGVVQAVCASDNVSLDLIACVKDGEKGVFNCKKILTHHMVCQIRPDICALDTPSLMNRILYKHTEDGKGFEHVCQKLFLTNLLSGKDRKLLSHSQIDTLGSFLVDSDCYLGEIRVSKKSTIHVVCESFVVAIKKRMWKTLESILTKGGNTLWKCMLVSHHTCHKFAFSGWVDDSHFPCLCHGMLRTIHDMPLRLLEIFMEIGKRAMSKNLMKSIKEKMNIQNEEELTETKVTKGNTATPRQENVLRDVILYHVRKMLSNTRGNLLILSKMTSLFPDIFPITIESLRFSSKRNSWYTASQLNPTKLSLLPMITTSQIIKQLRQENLEIRFWNLVANMSVKDVTAVQEKGLSLLHIACLQNDHRMASACLTVVVPLSPNLPDNSGLTPMDMASSRSNVKILNLLKMYGGVGGTSILVAACVGKGFLSGISSAAAAKKKDSVSLQESKIKVLDWLFQNLRVKLNLAYKHPEHGTMFDVILARHSWTLLDWILDNAGTDACAAVMSMSSNLLSLAFAPHDLIKKIGNHHTAIVEKMHLSALREILLKLSAFPGSFTAEYLLKKMISLKLLADEEKIIYVLNHKGRHGEGILHNACRSGNTSLVKCIITTLGRSVTSVKSIIEIIDLPDKSGCTPLWYSLAFRFWKLAEFMIVNGAQRTSKRSIPGLWNKRMYEEIPGDDDCLPRKQKAFLAPTQIKRSNSSAIADLISPASVIFRDLYLEAPCNEKINIEKSSDLPVRHRKSVHVLKNQSQPMKANQINRLVQDDMESVGCLLSPRAPLTPRSARTLIPNLQGEMQSMTMSPRKHYPDDDEDDETAKQSIRKKKRVRYLLSLVHFARLNRGTLLHAACSVGNFLLLKGIIACPLLIIHREKRPTYSPFLYSLVNSNPASANFCIENNLGPFDTDAFVEVLCFLIMKRYKFEPNHKTLKRLLNRFTIAKETIRGIKVMLIPRTENIRKLYTRGTLLDTVENTEIDDDYLKTLIPMAIKHASGDVSSRLLMTLAVTGSFTLFQSVLETVDDMTKLTELFKRNVVHRATFLDLIFILSPSRLFLGLHEKEYNERMKMISAIANVIRLEITPRTLSAAIKKNLLPMLEMVVQDYTCNNQLLQPPDVWYEAIFKAASNGELSFINTICVAEMNTKTATIQAAMLKSLCIACQKRHRSVANRLLLFKMPLNARVEGIPGRFPEKPRLALDCAIEGGDTVIASLILQTMEETGVSPTKDDILKCIWWAFDKGMEPIVDNLLQFAHFASPSLVTLRTCHWLFLSSARRGNGMVCLKFLDLPEFNCNASDDNGFTALHYAAMHGKEKLIREIVNRSEEAINTRAPKGLSPLDLARAFGHIDLGFTMVMEMGALQGTGFGTIMTQGWLSRFMKANKESGQGTTFLMSPAGSKSRSMDIVTLVRQGNDMAATGILEVAQESALACMLFNYKRYPLLHLCSQTGCFMTLEILLKLISAQPKLDISAYLLKERKGKIPLCVAIERCNVECVGLLIHYFYPSEWRCAKTGESILHFAARTDNEEIIKLLTEKADFAFLQAQDKDGLIPATTSIALGNHGTVKYFLNGLRFAEKMHHEHTTTTYWCILCLLDCCIGWSKVFLEGNEVALNGKGRNIFLRHRTESGFCVYLHKGNKATTSHTLSNVHNWIQHGASRDLLSSTLATMQYSQNGFKSELFLLLSQMTRFEALDRLIKIGKNEVACYLYEKLCPTLENNDKVNHFINAVAYGRLPVVKKILQLSGDEMSKLKFKGDYSALDVSVAFGHKELFQVVTHAFESSSSLNSLRFLEDSADILPQEVKWNLGMSRIGDKEWRESIDYEESRLSQVDVFLLKKPCINSFPETLLPRDIMPISFKGKMIEVNHQSMSAAITELGVTDTWLTSLLVSKAVLGRYYEDVVESSEAWKQVEKVVLSCVTPSSSGGARMELKNDALLDVIQVTKTKNSQGEATFQLATSSFPIELTPYHGLKERVMDKVIPSVKEQIKKELFGLEFDISVDWNTIEASHDFMLQRQLLLALEGKEYGGPVAGLLFAVKLCGEMLRDIEILYNRETVTNMLGLFESVKEIQVKYIRVFPKSKDNIWLPNEGKIIWHFSLEDGRPKFITSLFSLSILTQMFHTVAVCLSHSTRMLLEDNEGVSSAYFSDMKRVKRKKRVSSKAPTLLIKWRSFMFLNRLKILTQFVGSAVAPHITLIAAQYKAMLRLQMSIHTIVIQNTMTEEEAGLSFDDGVLLITIHSFTLAHKPWSVTPLDSSRFFNEMEITQLSKKWRAGSVNVTASRHRALTALLENVGFPIDLPMAGQNILEMLCRLEARQMVHPYELLKLFGTALYKHISQGYIDSIISKLSFCRQAWLVGTCKAPPGIYSWVRCSSLRGLSLVQQVLAYAIQPGTKKPKFLLVSKHQLLKIPSTRIFGIWYKISTLNIYETLRHSAINQAQMIVIREKAFLIIASSFVESFLTSLPEAVSVGFVSGSSHTKCISFDEAFAKPLDLFSDNKTKKSSHSRPSLSLSVESYDFLTWQLGASKGFNVIFEYQDFNSDSEMKDKSSLHNSFFVSYATYSTFKDVTDFNLYEKPIREIMISIFKRLVNVTVGTSVPSKCLDLITGDDFEESADVYILSDQDIHIMCRGTMWLGDGAGSPYSQTMLVALCSLFLQQPKSRLSNVLAKNISRTINPSDIKFRERVTSADQVTTLSTTRQSVRSLEKSINRILTMSSVGSRKLKMDLTGVEFSEHKSGPVVSFDSGVLRCSLFSVPEEVDQKTMDRDFLIAVDEEEARRLMLEHNFTDSRAGHRKNQASLDIDDLHSVTTSEVLTICKEQSVLDKQRIVKPHSDDSHVVLRAVKRLFSGVEIGRTADIMDSLDIGANVNSVNENGETPLIVAAKSRNYTIIDLLLTRGAATHLADAMGVTALHYEAGQGDNEAVKLMLSHGADPNAQDLFGRTPLHYAVVRSHQETIDLLVFCGADASLMNKDGESPNSLAQNKAIKKSLKETDLMIKGLSTSNVSIEHLTLQADTIYRMAGTGLTVRTPSGMGLSKTSLMVRRVVPEYSLYGPQPDDFELLLSDVYDFRISGACVEEPLLLQIPVYAKAEQYEDILIKTNENVYVTPIRIGRVVTQNKQTPQWMCHVNLCLHGVKSIVLVTRPKAERFSVTPSGLDFNSILDPLLRLQFKTGSVVRDCDVVVEVTSKPSYEEEDYDSILSMSHFYDIRSSNNLSLHDEVTVSLPLPENYLGHGVLHVLMKQQIHHHSDQKRSPSWVEILKNPDYAKDVVTLRVASFGQLCLMERNPHYKHPTAPENTTIDVTCMVTALYEKAKKREYSACFLAMAKMRPGKKSDTEAEVVVECILSSKIHARLQHWKQHGFVDLKPSYTTEFKTIPSQKFIVRTEGPCEQTGIVLPPLQFHPKRNNCFKFLVRQKETSGPEQGRVDISLYTQVNESPRTTKTQLLSQSIESLQTDVNRSRHTEEQLASIPLFLQWTAEPGDTRGQDSLEKVVLSPFDAAVIKADIRGTASSTTPSELPESTALLKTDMVPAQIPPIVDQPIIEEKEETVVEPTVEVINTVQPKQKSKSTGSSASKRTSRKDGRLRVANPGRYIRSISPVRKMSMPAPEMINDDSSSISQCSSTPQGDGGLLDWLAEDLSEDWLRMGVMLGVPYTSLQAWAGESHLSDRHRTMKMLHHWKNIRSGRPDHGVPELLMTLQRLNKTALVHSLKTKLKTWIDDNLEKKGHLKAVVNKSLLEDTEILEPMSPLFLLALVRKIGFRVDLIYDLGLSRPEVSWVMSDPFLKHREDKMLGLLVMFNGKMPTPDQGLNTLLAALRKDGNVVAHDWIITTSRQWLMHQGSADDNFAHSVGQMLQDKIGHGLDI